MVHCVAACRSCTVPQPASAKVDGWVAQLWAGRSTLPGQLSNGHARGTRDPGPIRRHACGGRFDDFQASAIGVHHGVWQ